MKIYHVYDSYDSAETDMFYATKREALNCVKEIEKLAKQCMLKQNSEIHEPMFEVLELRSITKQEVCRALIHWPQR